MNLWLFKNRVSLLVLLFLCLHISLAFSLDKPDKNNTRHQGKIFPFIAYPVEKIRPTVKPTVKPPASNEVSIEIAGNEYESAIFGIFNGSESQITIDKITINPGTKGKIQYNLFSVRYIDIRKSSRWFKIFGIKGRWPDPLIPPSRTTIPPRENRLWFIEFYNLATEVPAKGPVEELTEGPTKRPAKGPSYGKKVIKVILYFRGNTRDNTTRTSAVSFTFDIKPLPFSLPRKSSFTTAFGFTASLVRNKHKELSSVPFDFNKLKMDYLHLLARHRIFVYYPMEKQIPVKRDKGGNLRFDWSEFDAVTGALLDGKLFNDVPSQTSFRTPHPPKGLSKPELAVFYRELGRHLKAKGWLDRVFYYLPDEPLRAQYPQVRSIASFIKEASPGIRTLVTEPFTRQLEGYIDIWCPDITHIGDSVPFLPAYFKGKRLVADWQWNPYPTVYRERRKLGETTWFYTCMSAQFMDYPNLFIDSRAMYNRIIPWLAYRYGFTGLLYYQTVYDYHRGRNPWKGQYQFYCNGDGNLLYPGTPEIIDSFIPLKATKIVSRHIPVPSLRLKLLRDGMEDYEYLKILEKKKGRNRTLKYVKQLCPGSLKWERDVSELRQIREKIIQEITGGK